LFLFCVRSRVAAAQMELQIVMVREFGDEPLIRIGLGTAQLMIEVRDGQHDAECVTHIEQQAEQRSRISASRNRNRNSVARLHQLDTTNLLKQLVS